MHRRELLLGLGASATAAILTPELAKAMAQSDKAAAAGLDWRIAFADLEADLPRTQMRLVRGRAPAGLAGRLYRNGPGKFHRPGGSVTHWFDGDGLVRAFRISEGRATLEARFVDTPKRRTDTEANAVVTPGFGTAARAGARVRHNDDVNAANISVIPVGDELWALWEGGSPIALDPTDLSTRGVKTLRSDLIHAPFLAHPRREPGGDIWNLGVSGAKALVWRVGSDGTLKSADMIELPVASYIHDFTATKRHLVLILQPWVQSRMVQPFADSFVWKPDLGTKVLVLDKDDLTKRRIFELPTVFAFHYGAAWEETDGTIRFDGCFSQNADFATINGRSLMQGSWTPEPAPILGLVSLGANGRARLDPTGRSAEFPRTDGRFAGGARRWTIHATGDDPELPLFNGVATHDWKTGRADVFRFDPGQLTEEAVFVGRPDGSDELDGWILMPSVNTRAKATELHVFDARRLADGPVCTWRADRALPVSLHGTFVRG